MRTILLPHAEVRVFPDPKTLNRAAADEFGHRAAAAINATGRFMVALSGGSTPKAVYSLLADDEKIGAATIPWDRAHIFFGDERHVPSDHPDSNFRMAKESLLAHVPIPEGNIHRVRCELDAQAAAHAYEGEIRSQFGNPVKEPPFDLIMLGLGPDGHTASLFPGSSALVEQTALVCSTWVEKLNAHRITFTFRLINSARDILFLAGGSEKAAMLHHILHGDPSGVVYPAQKVQPVAGRVLWLVDDAAASAL